MLWDYDKMTACPCIWKHQSHKTLLSNHHKDTKLFIWKTFEMKRKVGGTNYFLLLFFFVFHSDDISDTGFSTFQHAKNCCSHSRAALGKCSMCVHEWKPLFTMVRHETSFMFCVFVSLSVSQLSAALLGWLRKDLLFSWGNCLYSAHLVGRYGGVERRDKSHWIT